jgi:branched-chain amino acid transport system permease protein
LNNLWPLIAQQAVNAASLGAIYALLAVGLALIYSVLGLINFAHGELMTIAGYALVFLTVTNLPWLPAALLAIAAAVGAALAMERVAFRPVRGAEPTTLLLTSVAVGIVVQTSFQIAVSPQPLGARYPAVLYTTIPVADVRIGVLPLVAAALAILATISLGFFLKLTVLGLSIRAAAEDFTMTRVLGVRASRVVATTFALSGLLAGIAGLMWAAQRGSVDPLMGSIPLLKAFVAAVLGGLGSIPGAVLGAVLLGVMEIVLQAILPSNLSPFRDAIVFGIVIGVLTIRPRGLLPPSVSERV